MIAPLKYIYLIEKKNDKPAIIVGLLKKERHALNLTLVSFL
jgi:hypothetical protein